ncbi:MAG: peptide chain release factor 1 [Kiritimatiellia bacterium]|nr:peptide chain release factor 1 [Lentisphaerota bacterium]
MLTDNLNQAFAEEVRRRLAEREHRMSDPAMASNPVLFRQLIKAHARLKKILCSTEQLLHLRRTRDEALAIIQDKLAGDELQELACQELQEIEPALPAAEQSLLCELMPPDPTDDRNTIMEIRAGAGGQESSLFAADLLRMYMRFAESRKWQVEILDASTSEAGGYKEVVYAVQGENVFRTLQYEAGTHRVQRVPVTEACGRIHTSTVTVAVLPEADEMDAIEIKPEDLKIDVYRASGAGGQHVNKTDSAIRITHLPSGIVVASQEERSQHKNRAKAMRVLRSRLLARQKEQNMRQIGDERRSQIGTGERSGRIRTYNFPQNRLTDHRINFSSHNLTRVLEGDLDELLEALHADRIARRMQDTMDINRLIDE